MKKEASLNLSYRKTLYHYELKKLFCSRVNLAALAGSVIMLLFLASVSVSEKMPVSRDMARAIDAQLLEEMKPALRYENGLTVLAETEDYQKYLPVLETVIAVTGEDADLTDPEFRGEAFYELRAEGLAQRMEQQRLSEEEKDFWKEQAGRTSEDPEQL